ncbi:RNA-guided endonuclease TnpB family protein [Fibrella sp. WM1]|uniref:RNA-guided endonuclease TnpB family protein n=1 Tax=Fibrella musci TaxID=3242485 RepID=UPI003521F2BB
MRHIAGSWYVTFQEMSDVCGVPKVTIKQGNQRGAAHWQLIEDPADKRRRLIKYDSLKPEYQCLVNSNLSFTDELQPVKCGLKTKNRNDVAWITYRLRLEPTAQQKQRLAQHFGAVRFVYNWALETKERAITEKRVCLTTSQLSHALTTLKCENHWLKTAFSGSLTYALLNLDNAYERYHKGISNKPTFKKKGNANTFRYTSTLDTGSLINEAEATLFIPKIGYVKIIIHRPVVGSIKSVTIVKTPTDNYFACCQVDTDQALPPKPAPCENQAIGVDLGIKDFAVLSNGERIANPRYLNKSLKRLRRVQRRMSKKQKGSKNRDKARVRVARVHEKVANQRADFLHKTTTSLMRRFDTICIEDLNVEGMGKLRSLSRHLKDASFGTFRRQLTYKAAWHGKNLLLAARFAPTSKQCPCGHKYAELSLKQRAWTCPVCHVTHDRDLLAAQNIVRFAFMKHKANT